MTVKVPFEKRFTNYTLIVVWDVFDRLWFKSAAVPVNNEWLDLLQNIRPSGDVSQVKVGVTCNTFLSRMTIWILACFASFKCPPIPRGLPPLDPLREHLSVF